MSTQKIVRLAVLVALCAVGSLIKIPSFTQTVALDSLPGYVAAALFGGWAGAAVGALGHLISASTASFYLGLPVHLYVAVQMACYVSVFGFLFRRNQQVAAVILAIILNGVLAPALMIPLYGAGFFTAMILPLLIGSTVNIFLATIVLQAKAVRKIGEGLDVA